MTKQELELHRNTARVAGNLMVLLDVGLFPGKHSLGLEECKSLVKSVAEGAQAKLEPSIENTEGVNLAPAPEPAPAA